MQLPQDTRQLVPRYVEQGSVREDAVEAAGRKLQREKVLLPHFAAAVLACQCSKLWRALETDRLVPKRAKRRQVAPWTAAEIEYANRRRPANVPQQRVDVLLYVVVARALPEVGGALVVMLDRLRADESQIVGTSCHRDPSIRRNVMKTLFGSSVYSANGRQYAKPKLSESIWAGVTASMEPVSLLKRSYNRDRATSM